ncbi:MAG: flagellar M-ring protein FliF [Acetobacteraceae bacterium]|nr:flagellar M-ring protein FliF [Acetobacteraceae bacterium]
MNALAASLRTLEPMRLAALAGVGLAVMGLLVFLSLRGGGQPMALLYGDLDLRDSASVVQALDRARIQHRLGNGGAAVMVAADDVARARLLLAGQGLPAGGSVGYEIFDRQDGLTTTGFQQTMNQLRALEGELARTIRSLSGVRNARVHLVLPRREPFQRERQEAQASVVLTMAGAGRLDREQVQAVLHLVSAAVPGLSPRNVSIVDSRGELLARSGQAVGGMGLALNAEEVRRAQEARLARGVEEMLERIVGPGRVRVEVAAEMDFDRITENRESFDPDQQVARSVQSNTENSRSREANTNTSVANNLPNAEPSSAQAGNEESRTEETTNYEIGRTVRQLVREAPSIRRLSVAVLVDHASERAEPGAAPAARPRSEQELAQLVTLVKSAVGFDERRGDAVQVVNMRFAGTDEAPAAEAPPLFGLLDRANLTRLVETLVLGIVAVLALLLVARPAITRLLAQETAAAMPGLTPAMAGAAGALAAPSSGALPALAGPGAPAALAGPAAARALAGPGGTPLLAGPGAGPEDERMIDVNQIEGQMRASTLRTVSELVATHPEESLSILRGWMTADA